MGTPSIDALAMAGADWAQQCYDGDDDGPPEHLRAFEAFLDEVVPVDMVLEFERARRRREAVRPRSYQEDVKEKLKLWAKAVATKARQDAIKQNSIGNGNARAHDVLQI
ncbi:hypothetical protein BS78_02G167500 [Paspalum vaginatum]|nr:hypothetical protein BS78_02G167500 [Paspalum vaginatum]